MRFRAPSSGERKSSFDTALDLVVLAVAAWSSPLATWANNPVGIGHPERLFLLGAVPFLVAVIGAYSAQRRGARRVTAVGITFLALLVVTRGALLPREFGPLLGVLAAMAVIVSVGYLVSRRRDQTLVRWVMVALSLVLVGGAIGSFYRTRTSLGADVSLPNGDGLDVTLEEAPDVFLVLSDGYAGSFTLASDFGVSTNTLSDALLDEGFQVPRSAWSGYSTTETSFSSLLDMSYPVGPGRGVEPATQRTLHGKIGGTNRLVDELAEAGYTMVMIESGAGGSSCGPNVDVCVPSPFMDEAVFWTISRSLFRPLVLGSFGYAFTAGTQGAMSWLDDNADEISTNGRPDLVVAHLMAPHPPLFLDAECRHRYADELSGLALVRGGDDVGQRREAYLEQARCVDGFLLDLADRVGDDAVVVFVADHGTDSRNQLTTHPSDWSIDAVSERLNVLMAVRIGPGCSVGDEVLLPNLMRRVLSCLSTEDLPDLEARMFKIAGVGFDGSAKSPVVEVDGDLVEDLLEGSGRGQ